MSTINVLFCGNKLSISRFRQKNIEFQNLKFKVIDVEKNLLIRDVSKRNQAHIKNL